MPSVSLRHLISAIGIAIAFVAAIAPPVGYAVTSYFAAADALEFKARLNAGRVARYVYTYGDMWRFHQVRLAELIELPGGADHVIHQHIYAAPDRLVLDNGIGVASPVLSRTAAITVSGAAVGRIELQTSLAPLLQRTGWLAFFSTLFGFLSLFFLRTLPLRVLEQTFAKLEHREAELRAQNYRFETALDNMSQGLCMFNDTQQLIVCNRRYAEIYGIAPEHTRPGTPLQVILDARAAATGSAEDSNDYVEYWFATIPFCEPHYETVALRDGRILGISYRQMDGGGFISVHEDITERKRAEVERARAEIEAEQLRQQERAAELANQAKSSFLATMSHEIRTPMNAVLGLASTLLDTDLDSEQRRSIAAIHESGESLLRILNDILDFSKLEAGKLEFEELPFSPTMMTEHLQSMIAGRAAEKGLAVRVACDRSLPPALGGDPGRLRQVLLNLLTNAVKFTTSGEIVIVARCSGRTPSCATVEWSVRDTGIGIPPERIPRLFTDFVQADSSINRRFGGSGLGLAISKRLIEQMGGTIDVTSTPGVGTTFRITLGLPWADVLALTERNDDASIAALKARIASLGCPLRVLVAEDNPTNQLVATKMLKEFDVQIHLAGNGAEAVAAVDRFAFDLVFMDMRMPDMDGLEATRAIRARTDERSRVPIIALTANAFADDMKMCREAGMNDFVAKPVRKHALVDAMLRTLRRDPRRERGIARPLPAPMPTPAPVAPAVPQAASAVTKGTLVVDQAAIARLVEEIGLDGARETLDVFLRETTERLARLRALGCDAERRVIQNEAHTLKGASGTFGLLHLAAIARSLEQSAGEVSEGDYRTTVERLEQAFALARSQIPSDLSDAA